MSVTVWVPGRAALLGEHCDWAGGASLAVPLPLGVTIEARPAERKLTVETVLEGERLVGSWPESGLVDRAGGALRFAPAALVALREIGVEPPPAHLDVRSDLPAGRGFSSSAAYCVAAVDALARLAGRRLPPEELAELAFHVEHDLLGVGCGRLDQLACALGRADEGGVAAVFLRWEDGLPVEVRRVTPGARFHLVIAAFSVPRDTAGILHDLREAFFGRAADPAAVEGARRAIGVFGVAAENGAEAVAAGDARALGVAMDRAQNAYDQELARRLPALAAPGLRLATTRLRALGALGAKFSGAGGDGSVVALLQDDWRARDAVSALRALGLGAWSTPFG